MNEIVLSGTEWFVVFVWWALAVSKGHELACRLKSSQAYAVTLGGSPAKCHGQCAQLIRSLCGDPVQQNMIWLLRNIVCVDLLVVQA